jgi:transposase
MSSRYELSESKWERIKDFLRGRREHEGRTAADHRTFVNGVLWVLRSGARWSDLPLDFLITAGQISDYIPAIELLGECETEAVISPRRHRKQPREYDKTLYKLRNRIERCFSKLKQFRHFGTRYERFKNASRPSSPWPAPPSSSIQLSIRPGPKSMLLHE